VTLLRDDVVLSMPPYDLWLQGPEDLATWFLGPGIGCKGGRLRPVAVNGGGGARPDAPWGGPRESGIGREGGEAGFQDFFEIKHIQWPVAGPARPR